MSHQTREQRNRYTRAWRTNNRETDRSTEMPEFDLRAPITYGTAVARVNTWRGKAVIHKCYECRKQAAVWAYRRESFYEARTPVPAWVKRWDQDVRWSPDPMDYDPLCRPCHGQWKADGQQRR